MKLPRVRFTVRRLMVAVSVVGLALGGWLTYRRWVVYREKAAWHAAQEGWARFYLGGGMAVIRMADGRVEEVNGPVAVRTPTADGGLTEFTIPPTPGYDAETLTRRADHHARFRRKYEHASARPWLAVVPDPPGPH